MKEGDIVDYKYKNQSGVYTGKILYIDDEKVLLSTHMPPPQNDYYAQLRYKQKKGLWYMREELQFLSD